MPSMAPAPPEPSSKVLDPIARTSEVLFGLIMALTFTGSLSAASAGREEIRTMLIGAIGCNIAWGLIDAVMHLVTTLTERGRNLRLLRTARGDDAARARQVIRDALPQHVLGAMSGEDIESLRARLAANPEPAGYVRLHTRDFKAAIAIFFLVVCATFPVVVPFIVMQHASTAIRVSNGVAVVMMFACGLRLGRYGGGRGWGMGVAMAVVGAALTGLTIALGG